VDPAQADGGEGVRFIYVSSLGFLALFLVMAIAHWDDPVAVASPPAFTRDVSIRAEVQEVPCWVSGIAWFPRMGLYSRRVGSQVRLVEYRHTMDRYESGLHVDHGETGRVVEVITPCPTGAR